jgi:hypothetical protein
MPVASNKNALVLDMHLHVVPGGSNVQLLEFLAARVRSYHQTGALVGAVLYSRGGFDGWAALAGDMEVCGRLASRKHSVMQVLVDDVPLWLFRGQQVNTAERVEVLCILPQGDIPDGLPFEETLARCEQLKAIPVLPWSPGKWLGTRREVVREAILGRRVRFVGDVPIRFWGKWLPLPFSAGVRVLGGSDPLTFTGEEAVAGSLLTSIESDSPLQVDEPDSVLRTLMIDPTTSFRICGAHGEPVTSTLRWIRSIRCKR